MSWFHSHSHLTCGCEVDPLSPGEEAVCPLHGAQTVTRLCTMYELRADRRRKEEADADVQSA